jgi:hypothetical protein
VKQKITDDELAQAVIKLIKEKKPENVQQLVDLAEEESTFEGQSIIELVLRLQGQGKIRLKEQPTMPPQKLHSYLKTEGRWYWATLILAIATTLVTLTLPENAYPLVYIRYVLGMIFVLWLPGYGFIRALYPKLTEEGKSTKSFNPIERTALSLGMSLVLVSIVGLLLNYSPWGIRLTPIILSLLSLTVIFATAAIIREHRGKLRKETR